MKKLTKRKAFNFLRSYFDVLNEIPDRDDKLDFLLSLINKQFLDEDPNDLNFIVNLSYQSQRHQIEESVKGWKRATNQTLAYTPPTPLGTTPPTPLQEEEEKGKEEEKLTEGKPSTKKSLEQRKEQFKIDCFPYMKTYGKDLLTKFFLYWSEHSERGVKMRFEKEKVFNIKLRLATWAKNDKEWNKNKEVDPLVENVMKQVNALKK
jgi:hypothetical protein